MLLIRPIACVHYLRSLYAAPDFFLATCHPAVTYQAAPFCLVQQRVPHTLEHPRGGMTLCRVFLKAHL